MRKRHSPFLASIRSWMLAERYAMATIDAYLHRIKSYIRYNCLCHPAQRAEQEVQQLSPSWPLSTMWLPRPRPSL